MEANQQSTSTRPGRAMVWVTPRTIGTAFVKCMTGLPDSEIWYEPYGFGHYARTCLKKNENVDLPTEYEGNEAIFKRAADIVGPVFGAKIYPERLPLGTTKKGLETSTSKIVFVKDESIAMASDLNRQYLPTGFKHSFLIRSPIRVYASLHKAYYKLSKDTGMLLEGEVDESTYDLRRHDELYDAGRFYPDHNSMWKYIRANHDPNPIILDTDDLLTKPADVLPKYCEAMGLPYSESLLQWDGSIESAKEWKIAGDGIYDMDSFMHASMTSTHFAPPKEPPSRDQLTPDVIDLVEKAMPFYEEMYKNRLGA